MPTTVCPDCNRQVSTAAAACPHCGRPAISNVSNVRGTRTVEQTGKIWKATILLGAAGLLWSIIWGMTSEAPATGRGAGPTVNPLPILLGVGSFAVLLFGRLGAWWFHR